MGLACIMHVQGEKTVAIVVVTNHVQPLVSQFLLNLAWSSDCGRYGIIIKHFLMIMMMMMVVMIPSVCYVWSFHCLLLPAWCRSRSKERSRLLSRRTSRSPRRRSRSRDRDRRVDRERDKEREKDRCGAD